MKLQVEWKDFQIKIDEYYKKANEFLTNGKDISQQNFDSVKTTMDEFVKECYQYLKTAFADERNEFAQSFYNSKTHRYNFNNSKPDFNQKKKELLEDFKEKFETLNYIMRILSISDAIIKPKETDLEIRKNYTTAEILELILDKLYDLYDNFYYPIDAILNGNGIVIKKYDEDRELIKILENKQYINVRQNRTQLVQLKASGKIYVEEKRKVKSIDYSKIKNSQEEINDKIDLIISELNKINLGNEILFNELEELKELYTKLNKKNWGQVLKGKLIDLGLSQVISVDVIQLIYKELTEHTLHLM